MFTRKTTADGKEFLSIEKAGEFKAQLFPINYTPAAGKKSKLSYNCNLYLVKSQVGVSFDVRQITEGEKVGEFLAGDKSRLSGHRAVVTEYLTDTRKVIEKATIPYGIYKDLMDEIKLAQG